MFFQAKDLNPEFYSLLELSELQEYMVGTWVIASEHLLTRSSLGSPLCVLSTKEEASRGLEKWFSA